MGYDSGNVSRVLADITKRELPAVGLQELEKINHQIQAENAKLRRLLQDTRKEKQRLLCELQAKDEALEKPEYRYLKVNTGFPISYYFHDDEFAYFEKHTIGIGSKILKKMGH